MFRLIGLCCFALVFVQARPDGASHEKRKCFMDLIMTLRSRCCKYPRPVLKEVFDECHIPNIDLPRKNFTKDELKMIHSCDNHLCVFKKINLLVGEDKVDKEAYKVLLDKYAEKHPEMKTAVENAKTKCTQDITERPDLCEPIKVGLCSGFNFIKECPEWDTDERCNGMKEKVEECKAITA